MEATAGTSHTCEHEIGGRNLIVCIDGTANQFGEKNTNVIELYNCILKESGNQKTWYNSGIGTYAQASWTSFKSYRQVLSHKIDLAVARHFKRTILGAYRWLSDNYEPGDCIFLFGFSRGAFQVRVLSAMIDKVGLIHKGNEMQIPFAYEIYVDPKSDEPTLASAKRFKEIFSYKDVRVHFVGAWDTVSSIGIARDKMLPRTIDGMKHVCFFRHALALDEKRVRFLPEYAYGGLATKPDDKNPTSVKHGALVKQTMEVWFPGAHSDIGRHGPALRWMTFQAGALGLRTKPFGRELNEQINVEKSLQGLWWPLEILPLRRLTYTRRGDDGKKTTHKPHLGSSRKIHANQKIHGSLLLAGNLTPGYTPQARPLDDDLLFWERVREEGLGNWLELDLFDAVRAHVEKFIKQHDSTVWLIFAPNCNWG
ncbi:uncharacterized protein LACBIDRAFT_304576 [Laccaria bicolor S238N-H82]|uniref:Predicted protein n=1 Tax=Laccaria bicolor (strain S238N-H82 / ATCC MYA-4686) TaxID=486041 RepID=B0DLX9_LACBS|nr:uncharacterized protein LACBIDRAFT_304576 [Laccaria bicolor S238N-H82]EDR04371.1 predicted protein [Laccaria bicolor S238N-H82]|eukprot:XP_001884890.1 predicted protein [Laccaria bicolor S238N-H82]